MDDEIDEYGIYGFAYDTHEKEDENVLDKTRQDLSNLSKEVLILMIEQLKDSLEKADESIHSLIKMKVLQAKAGLLWILSYDKKEAPPEIEQLKKLSEYLNAPVIGLPDSMNLLSLTAEDLDKLGLKIEMTDDSTAYAYERMLGRIISG